MLQHVKALKDCSLANLFLETKRLEMKVESLKIVFAFACEGNCRLQGTFLGQNSKFPWKRIPMRPQNPFVNCLINFR